MPAEDADDAAPSTRERILEAAREALFEKGLEADIHTVIERAGVGTGTLYRHYSGKQALYRIVALELVNRTRDEFLEIAAHVSDARECVSRTMELGFRNLQDYGQLAIEVFAGVHPPEYADLYDRSALEAFFRALIERGIHQGHFRKDIDVEHAVGVWFALTAPSVLGRLLGRRSVEEIARSTTRFFLSGLAGD
ncbi:MAG: TetR/AcrR family transcriptional regulator [Myxococcota bacterium]|nr:TetR/AcrR family transcriptional regulator [Myxococcota bacterium]